MLKVKIDGHIQLELTFGDRDIVFAPFTDGAAVGVSFQQFDSEAAADAFIADEARQFRPSINLKFNDTETIDLIISTLEHCKKVLRGGDDDDNA